MSGGGPSKYCPRCNTQLPAQAMFCSTCQYQFAPVPGTAYGSSPDAAWAPTQAVSPPQGQSSYSPQGQTPFPPQGQPNYPPQMQPNYPPQGPTSYSPQGQPAYPPQGQTNYSPQGQPAYPPQIQPGYAPFPSPGAATQKGGGAGKFIIIALVVVVLVGGGAAAWFLYLNPGRCSGPLFDAHSLPSSVPLPSGCAFDAHPATQTTTGTRGAKTTSDAWLWAVNSNDQAGVQTFYLNNLPGKGWANPKAVNSKDGKEVIVCQGNQLLLISTGQQGTVRNSDGTTMNFTAPSGGTLLGISLVTADNAQAQLGIQFLCTGQLPTPTP